MKKKILGLCALATLVVTAAILPADAAEVISLSITNTPAEVEEQTLIVSQYHLDEGSNQYTLTEYYRLDTTINRISMGGNLTFTAIQDGTSLYIDVLTDLNGDGYYEWLDNSQTIATVITANGVLIPATQYTSTLEAGDWRTLSATDLRTLGLEAEQARMADGDTPIAGLSLTTSGDIIYRISSTTQAGDSQSYYFVLDRTLDDTTSVEQLGAGAFSDVPSWAWYWDEVDWAVRQGILTGVDLTHFDPDGDTTRAALMQVLYRMVGEPETTLATFTDVTANHWFADAVSWGYHQGLVSGFPDGTFQPNQPLTRQQLAVIVYNASNLLGVNTSATADLTQYADGSSVASWASEAMSWAVATGVLDEVDGSLLDPNGTVSRATLAAVLQAIDQM